MKQFENITKSSKIRTENKKTVNKNINKKTVHDKTKIASWIDVLIVLICSMNSFV